MFVNPLRNKVVLNDGSTGSLYVGVILADGKTLGQTDGKARLEPLTLSLRYSRAS